MVRKVRMRLCARQTISCFIAMIVLTYGCSTVTYFPIKMHRFTVTDMRKPTADRLVKELKLSGYNVAIAETKLKTEVASEKVYDYVFEIRDPNYTTEELPEIVNRIINPNRQDPVVLDSTIVQQVYTSASGLARAQVRLRIDLTKNARAYYKDTGAQVAVNWDASGKSAWFLYNRKPKQEYVYIYILPVDAPPGTKPKKYQRISLHHPYEVKVMDWHVPWYRRLFGLNR